MKIFRIFTVVLLAALMLCSAAAAASSDGFNAGLTIDRSLDGIISVTVENSAILAEKRPTLSIPCDYEYAKVTCPDNSEQECVIAEGSASFTVFMGGTYIIRRTAGSATVTLDACGGSVNPASITVNIGDALGNLPTPTRANYSFNGWFTHASGGSAVTAQTVVNESFTVYAQWTYSPPYTPPVEPPVEPPVDPTPEPEPEIEAPTVDTDAPVKESTVTESEDGSTVKTEVLENGAVIETTTKPDGSTTSTATKTDTTESAEGKTTTTTTVTESTDAEGSTVKESKEEVKLEKADGTVEIKTTAVTETEHADGSVGKATLDDTGKVEASVAVSAAAAENAAKAGEAVALPMPAIPNTADDDIAPVVRVELPAGLEEAVVEIPVEQRSAGTVAVIVHENGTEEIVKTTGLSENGIIVNVPDGATVKVIDNAEDFDDVKESDWHSDAVKFASSRQLFQGVGENSFAPSDNMTRGMILTVLARLDGYDTTAAEGEHWHDPALLWAKESGISDASDPFSNVTREQAAVMLWRYVGQPESDHSPDEHPDADQISFWAEEAMAWATEIGLINGKEDKILDPVGSIKRSEVAQLLMNFIELMGNKVG